jgi:ATP-dependent HslUV protease ATP-binding subunit HslU
MTDERYDFTPRETVGELDRYIVGQNGAKRAVAIALRNRWRRMRVTEELRQEIYPKNILMIGPTGVGKTEIARRLAKMIRAPFVKVEASKFTEVGYVGRDVESMVRDLVEEAVNLERESAQKAVEAKADLATEERLLDLLLPSPPPARGFEETTSSDRAEDRSKTRETFRRLLREGKLDERVLEIEVTQRPPLSMIQNFSSEGVQDMVVQLQDMMGVRSGPKKRRKSTVKEARDIIREEEATKLVDMDQVHREALKRAEESGIIFVDEIDKIIATGPRSGGPDVSREGVQRDLLPIVEGSTVSTKYGRVRTDHVLFIAAGAFHGSKVSDLIPELQGRFPIRVELGGLSTDDFVRILKEPKNSLVKQYVALLETEGLEVDFDDEAIVELAQIAAKANQTLENIGARRLHTVMEALLEEISFDAPERKEKRIHIDKSYVQKRLGHVLESEDLSRFVL